MLFWLGFVPCSLHSAVISYTLTQKRMQEAKDSTRGSQSQEMSVNLGYGNRFHSEAEPWRHKRAALAPVFQDMTFTNP